MIAALGVVFGDIGTSPLYTLKECFGGEHALPPTPDNVLGVVSLIFWSVLIVISLKYVTFIMRADNKGEGGIMALMSLVAQRVQISPSLQSVLMMLGLPVAFSFLAVNLVGAYVFLGGTSGIEQLVINTTDALTSFTLVPIAMFMIMGEVMFRSGIANDLMDTLDKWFGKLKGRLAFMAVGGGVLFSTLTGNSMGAIALLGSIESLLSAVVADGMAGTRHDSNQELIGQGIANIVAPLFGGIMEDDDYPSPMMVGFRPFPPNRPPFEIFVNHEGNRFLQESSFQHLGK